MFKGRPSKLNGLAVSIIEEDPAEYSLMPQDILLAGLRDVAIGLPAQLLNHTVDQYLREEQPELMPNYEVDHPKHYRDGTGLEAIEVIEAWDLNFNLGNVVKYVCRAGLKDKSNREEDLHKAIWYLNRELNSKG